MPVHLNPILNLMSNQNAQAEFQIVEVKRSKIKATERLFDTLSSFPNQDDGCVIVFGLCICRHQTTAART